MDTQISRELGSATNVLRMRAQALNLAAGSLDSSFVAFVRALSKIQGRIIVIGKGDNDCVPRHTAQILSSSGTAALYMALDAFRENTAWLFTPEDTALVFADGKDERFMGDVTLAVSFRDIPLFIIAGREESVPPGARQVLRFPDDASHMEGGGFPSPLLRIALIDALAMGLMRHKGVDTIMCRETGSLGYGRFRRVSDIMRTGAELPLLPAEASLAQARALLRKHAPCVVGVLKRGRLSGVVSDADFRRMGNRVDLEAPVTKAMRIPAVTLQEDSLVAEALQLLRESGVPALFILRERRPVGIVGPYDCLRA